MVLAGGTGFRTRLRSPSAGALEASYRHFMRKTDSAIRSTSGSEGQLFLVLWLEFFSPEYQGTDVSVKSLERSRGPTRAANEWRKKRVEAPHSVRRADSAGRPTDCLVDLNLWSSLNLWEDIR